MHMRLATETLPNSFVERKRKLIAMTRILFGLILAVVFTACEKEKRECPSSAEKTFDKTGFTRLSMGGTFNVKVTQGNAFTIKARGCSQELDELVLTEQNGTLSVTYNQQRNDRYRVDFEITMPVLSSVALDGAATGAVSGFGQQASFLKAVLSGTAKCTITDLPALVNAELSGAAELTLNGNAPDLIAHLSGDAKLNAYSATFADADVYTSGTAKAKVVVQQSLFAQASGDSRIYYKGNPGNVNAEQSGTAKVIHE